MAALPHRLGGAGLRSAARTAPGAYWAAWADALPMIRARTPSWGATFLEALDTAAGGRAAWLQEATQAAATLNEAGCAEGPSWRALWDGARPPLPPPETDPGEWRHGWQYFACSAIETRHREREVLPSMTPAEQAALRSGSGPGAAQWLSAPPTMRETTRPP